MCLISPSAASRITFCTLYVGPVADIAGLLYVAWGRFIKS
jgi:hypothetical protein